MISHHPGTPKGDDYLARYEVGQVLNQRAEQLASDRSRFEPVKLYDEAHAEHLADVASEANQTVQRLGNALHCYVALRNRCEKESLDDALRIRAQQLIDELMPLYEAAKVDHLAKRNEWLAYECGG